MKRMLSSKPDHISKINIYIFNQQIYSKHTKDSPTRDVGRSGRQVGFGNASNFGGMLIQTIK